MCWLPVSMRTALDLRNRYEPKGGFNAVVIKLRLPDGRIYGQNGKARLRVADRRDQHRHDHIPCRGAQPADPGSA